MEERKVEKCKYCKEWFEPDNIKDGICANCRELIDQENDYQGQMDVTPTVGKSDDS